MMGLPRSGTTIVARVIGNHTRLKTVMEPYNSGLSTDFQITDVVPFCEHFGGMQGRSSLLVKETTTRDRFVTKSIALLRSCADAGVRPLSILILRSPIEAYLSQVHAAENLWEEKPNFHYGQRWVQAFTIQALRGLHAFLNATSSFDRRVINYNRFIADPAAETSRIIEAFPYDFEPGQLTLPTDKKGRPGDPKAWQSDQVEQGNFSKRDAEVAQFVADFAEDPHGRVLIMLHQVIESWTSGELLEDSTMWNEYERLMAREMERLGIVQRL